MSLPKGSKRMLKNDRTSPLLGIHYSPPMAAEDLRALLTSLTRAAAWPVVNGDRSDKGSLAQSASNPPAPSALVLTMVGGGAVTPAAYLVAARALGDGGTLADYRVVAVAPGLGERRTREPIASGRVMDPQRPTEVSASAASFGSGGSPAAEG
jgi:hypothetical protein